MTYEFLEHTADVMFEAKGKDLNELFVECSKALNETIHGDVNTVEQIKKDIKIEAKDLEGLLYKFLEEYLFLLDSENLIFDKLENLKIDDDSFILKATLIGDNAEKYHFTNDVKAITFNSMKIESKKGVFSTKVLLDV
jgi:SHS2 domain-containing protein